MTPTYRILLVAVLVAGLAAVGSAGATSPADRSGPANTADSDAITTNGSDLDGPLDTPTGSIDGSIDDSLDATPDPSGSVRSVAETSASAVDAVTGTATESTPTEPVLGTVETAIADAADAPVPNESDAGVATASESPVTAGELPAAGVSVDATVAGSTPAAANVSAEAHLPALTGAAAASTAPSERRPEARTDRPTASRDENASVASAPSAGGRERPDGGSFPASGAAVGTGAVALGVLARRSAATAATAPGSGSAAAGLARNAATHAGVLGDWNPRDWIRRLFGLFGYSRYDSSDPLAHDARAAIHDHLESSPGAYLSEISERTAIPLSTVRYHLKILEHEDLATGVLLRGKRRYFPAGTEPERLSAALADEGPAGVLRALARHGPASVTGLADRLDRDPSTVSYHVTRLADEGLVERERDGRAVINRLAPAVREPLARQRATGVAVDARAD